jgi:TetR/AcrR family fatty acid metabolism transcriptional regulator
MTEKKKKMNDVQNRLKGVAKDIKNNRETGDKRERILVSAENIFAEKGYFETTISEIAREAGVAEGTIYEYFANKKDLLYAVPEQNTIEYAEFVLAHLQGIKGALNKLRKLIWCHLHYFRSHRNFTKIMALEIRIDPDYFNSKTYENLKLYSDLILGIIREGIEDGEISPHINPHIVRDMILGTIEHVSIPWLIFGREIPLEDLVEDISQTIFFGLAPREQVLTLNVSGVVSPVKVVE